MNKELQRVLEKKAKTSFIISEDVEFADQEDDYDRVAQQKWVSLKDVIAVFDETFARKVSGRRRNKT